MHRSRLLLLVVSLVAAASTTAASGPGPVVPRCPPNCEIGLARFLDPFGQPPALVAAGTAVVFLGPSARGRPNDLWSVPVDGSHRPARLSRSTAGTSGVASFAVPDVAGRIAFLAETGPGVYELASAAIGDTRTRRRLSPALRGHTVDAFGGPHGSAIGVTDSGGVVFRMVPLGTGPSTLWAAPIDGSAKARLLSGDLHTWDFVLTPDGTSVVFRATDAAGSLGLYSAALHDAAPVVRLSPVVGGVDLSNHVPIVSVDGRWVAFLADTEVTGRLDLLTSEIGETGTDRLIAKGRPAGEGGIGTIRATPDGDELIFLNDPDGQWRFELFSSPFDAGEPPTTLSTITTPAADASVWNYEFAANNRVVYFGNLDRSNRIEMYSATIGQTGTQITLSASPLPDDEDTWVGFPFVSADGTQVAYIGKLTAAEPELFSAPVDRAAGQSQLSHSAQDGQAVEYFTFTPDSSRIVYTTSPVSAPSGGLFSVYADGRAPGVPLAGNIVAGGLIRFGPGGVRVTANGEWVLFVGDLVIDDVFEVFAVPTDGATDPVRLSRPATMVGTESHIVDVVECVGVFTHDRMRPDWSQLSAVTIPDCGG